MKISITAESIGIFLLGATFYLALSTGLGQPSPIYISVLLVLIAISFISGMNYYGFILIILSMLPCMITISLYTIISDNQYYAIYKLNGIVFSTIAISSILSSILIRKRENYVLNIIILVSVLVIFLTIIYKYYYGIYDRQVRFFINGSIIFGWLMGFNFVLSFYLLYEERKPRYFWLAVLFFGAALWAESKGPLISMMSVLALMTLHRRPWLVLGMLIVGGVAVAFVYPSVDDSQLGRFGAIWRLATGELSVQDAGSILLRWDMWAYSISRVREAPIFGHGLGSWSWSEWPEMKYPHNWLIEALYEMGIFGTTVLLLTFAVIATATSRIGRYVMLFFLLCSGFSGDLGYMRYVMAFPLAAAVGLEVRRSVQIRSVMKQERVVVR